MLLLQLDIDTKIRIIIGISAMVILFAGFLIVFIHNQRKKLQYHKELQALHEEQQKNLIQQNALLEQRVKERTLQLSQQKEELQRSLQELKATQLQLIQKEKMASLGELTAGIAHEIQNPLNFVNNFSEMNSELLKELSEALKSGDMEEVASIAGLLLENEQKINFHGKRADGIVKGMLQHSRKNTGEKEPTDINALADEFLRLSYHGMRVKEKGFNATIETHFDDSIGKVAIIPQEIGRVLLNLFNNAFYSVNEKKKQSDNDYKPIVSVRTKKNNSTIEIAIKDNGLGIPKKILDKVFQPFFTTKPTGEGTGLGLSLSYDIITKSHDGELKVNTQEGEGAEFIIELKRQESHKTS